MTSMLTPPRAPAQEPDAGRGGFARLLHAEWTKFRTVQGWVLGAVAAVLVTIVIGLLATATQNSAGRTGLPVGPDGEVVNDSFYFVHQPLAADGGITVSVASLTGVIASPDNPRAGTVPWAKAGIIVKQNLTPGSAYAAMMVTGGHGVRMQHDYTHDRAGLNGDTTSPRWLRLVRSGDMITGYDSTDGIQWNEVGTARLAGLSSTVEVGLFVTSPASIDATRTGAIVDPAIATGLFDHVGLQGGWSGADWAGEQLGHAGTSGSYTPDHQGGFDRSGGGFTITGAGDIAPVVGGPALGNGFSIENFLVGGFAGLIAVIVLGATFVTAEYRRGLIHVTLAASPRRGRVLAAKAVVIGAVAFVAGLVAALIVIRVGEGRADGGGSPVFPVTSATELRVVIGTGLLFAVTGVLALAVGTVMRRSAAAVTAVIAGLILPYILAIVPVLPVEASTWLLRVTPAAGFAVQQSGLPRYDQVDSIYTPTFGYYPLSPWAGFAVIGAYAVVALAAAALLLRRRDA
jgi:ABC-type transport system involved in multi-copper enzyme maturation permease subunit